MVPRIGPDADPPQRPPDAYVEQGGLGSAPGPLKCRETTLHGFWLQASASALERLCREVFDEPSGGRVEATPLLPMVLLTFGQIRAISAGAPFDRQGKVAERQVGIWVPVELDGRALGEEGPTRGMFLPFMWLDNPISVASGREVYGFPKTWGWASFAGESHPRGIFDFAGDDEPYAGHRPHRPTREGSGSFELATFALETHDPSSELRRHHLLSVTPDPRPLDRLRRRLGRTRSGRGHAAYTARRLRGAVRRSDGAAPAHLREAMPRRSPARWLAWVFAVLRRLTPRRIRDWLSRIRTGPVRIAILLALGAGAVNQFFLRQLRSPTEGDRASYQDIVAATAWVDPESNPRVSILGRHRLTLHELASEPLSRRLGVRSGRTHAEFTVTFDFEIRAGTVLWSSHPNPGWTPLE